MMKCLLIEDDIDDQELFCMALAEVDKSIECTIANDGVEALETLQETDTIVPDFIFMDVNMPRMNGLVCLREIKTLKHLDTADVFMFSTTSDQKLIDICLELGACEFIVKPAGLSALTAKLKEVITRNRKDIE